MDKKNILVTSAVIAFAVTMLFATVATPGWAAKKVQDFEQSNSFVFPMSICNEGDMAHLDAKTTVRIWDDGRMLVKGDVKGYFVDPSTDEKTGNYHSGFSKNTHGDELPITSVSKVKITCNGEGQVNNFHQVRVTVNGDLKVSHTFS